MARGGFYSVDSLHGVHALVVAADGEMRRTLSAVLRYCGALVTPAASPAEVLGVLRAVKANVLVVEVTDPRRGQELVRRVRALKPEDGGVVPPVAVVPSDRRATVEAVRSAGFEPT
jgi:CheY-like chemotaxis protein